MRYSPANRHLLVDRFSRFSVAAATVGYLELRVGCVRKGQASDEAK
jgi:hypothetical protein